MNAMPKILLPQVSHYEFFINALAHQPGYGPVVFNGIGRGNDNEDYFNKDVHPESETIKALVAAEWQAFCEITQARPMVYIPCGISSGLRAHEIAIHHARSTYKLDEAIGSDRHYNDAIAPNQHDNLRRSVYGQKLFPDCLIVPPVMREMAVRELVRNPALSGRLKYEEEAFMAFWYPLIDRCGRMVLDGDWHYSRNSIWEMMRGILVQSALVPIRPHADMDVGTINGDPVSLLWRAEKLADSLKYSLGKKFEPREAATGLAQIFTIDEWLRENHPIVKGAHGILSSRSMSERNALHKLRAEVDPLIIENCAGWLRPEDLLPRYQKAHQEALIREEKTGALHQSLGKEDSQKLIFFSNQISANKEKIIRGDLTHEKQAELDNFPAPQQRRFEPHSTLFGPEWRSQIAEDKIFDKLPLWEQAVLPFVFGAIEVAMFPLHQPMATAIFTDLKRGRIGFEIADKQGVSNIAELPAFLGRAIVDEVIKPNVAASNRLKKILQNKDPHRVVVNTPNLLSISDLIEELRKQFPDFVAAAGPNETSPRMRLLLAMKFLERNVDAAIFQNGWEHSDDLVQLRVRARLIQSGLAPRPVGDPIHLRVYTGSTDKGQDNLLSDVAALTRKLEYCATCDVSVPEQAMALIRLLMLDDLLSDARLRHDVIALNPHKGSVNWTDYNRKKFKAMRARAEKILFGRPELWPVDASRLVVMASDGDSPKRLQGIGVENRLLARFAQAQGVGIGEQERRQAHRPTDSTHYVFDTPQV